MPDPSSPLSTGPLPALPAAGAALLAHLLTALVEAVPEATGAALAVLAGDGGATGVQVLTAVGAAVGAAVAEGPGWVTVPVAGQEPLAVALLFERDPVPADAVSAAAALPGLALAVAVLREWAAETERAEQMVQMVQYRRVIEQAKGLVMAATGHDAAAAFATLARASQHFNVRLRNLAVALVEFVGGAPAEGPDDPAAVVVPGERDRSAAQRMWAALGSGGAAGSGKGNG